MNQEDLTKEKVNQERFFASGLAVYVAAELDLVEVADAFSKDNKIKVEQWMQTQQVNLVSDQQATDWISNDTMMWATVVKPWVLVQTV
jgi:hypothetical protein